MIMQQTVRTGLLAIGFLLGSMTAVAASQTSTGSNPADSADLSALKREWAETVETLKGYTAAQRDMAAARAKQGLDAMDRHIEQLESRTQQEWDSLSQQARESQEATLRKLRKQRNDAAEWYGGMKHSSAGAWETVRQGFIDSYGVLNDAFSKAWREVETHPADKTP